MIISKLSQVLSKSFNRLSLFKLHEAIEAKHDKYGSIRVEEKYWPVRRTIVYVFNPSDIEKILRAQGKFPYRPANEFLVKYRSSLPDRYPTIGIGNLQGDKWFSQRQLIAPILLSSGVLNSYLPHLNVITDDFITYLGFQQNQQGSINDLLTCTDQFSLESIAMICLNTRLGCLSTIEPSEDGKRLIRASKNLFKSFQILYHGIQWWKFWPTPSYKMFVAAEEEIYNVSGKYVDRALNELKNDDQNSCHEKDDYDLNDDSKCLLKTLLKTKGLDRNTVRTTAMDFMVGGINTVSTSLCFLLHHLSVNHEIQEKLFQELVQVIGNSQVDVNETHLSRLPYLKACLKESFRLTTVIPNLVRILPDSISLSGQTIPAGVPIMLSFGVICKHPDYFDEPETFRPERWLGDARRAIHPFSLLTFGLGNRMCAGRRMSEIELYIATAKIILKYKLLSETPKLLLKQDFIIIPENQIKIRLEPR
ncbi:ecdysone 20-monooxygenase-like [Panonychus citri]|uniref:CYP314A1 n=1 Tax=Panonychus citri TaxID=50023 RepID=A0A2H4LHN2_PANCT|nr:ecdysone 20-monooxygenase-like [Panonychus citri]XP_053204526.1 ecdysone 20-monooxygenase-like [Panonychus citri]ATB56334.1 CYP314A1 [Panonychus citri]